LDSFHIAQQGTQEEKERILLAFRKTFGVNAGEIDFFAFKSFFALFINQNCPLNDLLNFLKK